MADVVEALKILGHAFLDAWYVVDDEDRIIDFNPAFFALFPRAVGRKLKGMTCRDAVALPPCAGAQCLRQTCVASGPSRLDELEAQIADEKLRLIINAVPLPLPDGKTGALIVLRNVTDDARVQAQYQQMLEGAKEEKREMEEKLSARTRDLLAANSELNRLEREIARLKRGGL
jgi:PAS domain-containing protein